MFQHAISIPTPIGAILLLAEQILSFSRDERGGVRVILKEQIDGVNPEIISGYPYQDFKNWFDAHSR